MLSKDTNKTFRTPIVANESIATQGFSPEMPEGDRIIPSPPTKRDFFNLKRLAKNLETTDCINLIENFGFYDDAAVLVLGFLQEEGLV